jgi:hypothetical protein
MRKKTKTEWLQDIVNDYIAAGQPWPAPGKEIAAWAIRHKRWTPPQKTMVQQCAQELSDAMRAEMERDPQGRTIHAKHCAKIKEADENGNYVQKPLWFDNKNRTYKLMRISLQQWRRSISGECKQHRIEQESFNDNNIEGKQIQISLNFEPDLLDGAQDTDYNPPPDDDGDDV